MSEAHDTDTARPASDADLAVTAEDEAAARAVVVSMFHRALTLVLALMGAVCVVAGLVAPSSQFQAFLLHDCAHAVHRAAICAE